MVRRRQRTESRPNVKLGTYYGFGTQDYYYGGPPNFVETYDTTNYGWQDPNILAGGILYQRRASFEFAKTPVVLGNGAKYVGYVGDMLAEPHSMAVPSLIQDGTVFGPKAYNAMKPAEPQMDGLNALYELKDVPRLLKQKYHDLSLSGISSSHLAVQFGWLPLLRDIQSLCTTQRNGQAYLKQLIRDNGRSVRRRAQVHNESSSSSRTYGAYNVIKPNLPASLQASQPIVTDVTTTNDRVWASARFKFWLPPGPRDIQWTRRMIARIYGLHIRPSVVYNAVPWSWLVDWFSSLGDVISNVDGGVADRLATDYFYVMRQRETTISRTATVNLKYSSGIKPLTLTSRATATTKSRVSGNPFGLYITEGDLSPMQASILAAIAAQGKR